MQDTNCIAIGKGAELGVAAGMAADWRARGVQQALGRAGRHAGGRAGVGARRRQAAGAGGRGVWALGAGRAAGEAHDRQVLGTRGARGLGARRAGWPGLCTRCTPLGFQPGFSTRYFS